MNLVYKILWFEDEPLWAQPLVRELKSYVEDMGFKFLDPQFERDNTKINSINFGDFDLILMDYMLSSGEGGDVLIENIRSHNFFSEIVFYSSSGASKLRELVQQKELDGVYCVNRAREQFLPKVQEVIRVTVKKVLDLNTMRGIVMTETSDLDDKMIEIIAKYAGTLSEDERINFLGNRKKKLIESLNKNVKKIEREALDKFYHDWLFNASHKWRTVLQIVKKISPQRETIIEMYENEIIKMRDRLAHAKEKTDTDGNKYLADNDFVFNDEKCKEILNALKRQEENIGNILHILVPK